MEKDEPKPGYIPCEILTIVLEVGCSCNNPCLYAEILEIVEFVVR
jgi:hypothetical protein